jgi:hypothetical protein
MAPCLAYCTRYKFIHSDPRERKSYPLSLKAVKVKPEEKLTAEHLEPEKSHRKVLSGTTWPVPHQ